MAADAWVLYNNAKLYLGDGTFDMDNDLFHMILVSSSVGGGYTFAATDDAYSALSANETANGNGYTTGGIALTTTYTETGGTATFDATYSAGEPRWTASGGSIVARYAVIVHVNAGTGLPQSTDKLLAACLLDNSPADVTQADGGTLTVTLHSSGIFTLA